MLVAICLKIKSLHKELFIDKVEDFPCFFLSVSKKIVGNNKHILFKQKPKYN